MSENFGGVRATLGNFWAFRGTSGELGAWLLDTVKIGRKILSIRSLEKMLLIL